MKSKRRPTAARATKFSVQEALRRSPLPFAITSGADHTLVYANSAFCRLAGIPDDEGPRVPISTVFTGTDRGALSAILDRAFRDGVTLLDERINASNERASGWQWSVWPVITDDGRTEALGIQIRDSSPSYDGLGLQRRGAEQMVLGALRERGLGGGAEAGGRGQ